MEVSFLIRINSNTMQNVNVKVIVYYQTGILIVFDLEIGPRMYELPNNAISNSQFRTR